MLTLSDLGKLIDGMREDGMDDTAILDMIGRISNATKVPEIKPASYDMLPERSKIFVTSEVARAGSQERMRRYRERRRENGLPLVPEYSRHEVFARDGYRCVYCSSEENLAIDHMVPIVLGGTDDMDNLATACRACNGGKAGKMPQVWKPFTSQTAAKAHARYLEGRNKGAQQAQPNAQQPAQQTATEEPKEVSHTLPENNIYIKPPIPPKRRRQRTYSEHPRFGEFFSTYPKRLGVDPREPASRAFSKALDRGGDAGAITSAAAAYSALLKAQGKLSTEFIPMASTWLNQDRWRDNYGTATGYSPTQEQLEEYRRIMAE